MSKIIRLTEDDLITIIKRVISEQLDSKMPGQIEKFGYRQNDASTLGPALKRQEEHIRRISDFFSDPHKLLNSLSIGFTVLGMIPSPASPFLLSLGTAADVADSFLYYHEGDKYMGTIMLALSVIPGGEFLKATKNTVVPEVLKKLIKKASNGIDTLSKGELTNLKNLLSKFDLYKSVIGSYLTKNMISKMVKFLPKLLRSYPFKVIYKIIYSLFKVSGILSKLVFKIGATYFSADTVYLWLYGNDEDRKNSNVQKLIKVIKNEPQTQEEIIDQLSVLLNKPEIQENLSSGFKAMDPKEFEKLINPNKKQ
jgi:hypothetical protein